MKVLYLIEEIGGGGKERRLTELIKGLAANEGVEVYLILSKKTIEYVEILDFPIHVKYLKDGSNLGLVKQYYRSIKEIRPDIIHTWSFKTSFFVSVLKPWFSYKLISGFIGDTFGPSRMRRFLCKTFVFRKSNAIVANSEKGLRSYGVLDKKGIVVYNGFDPKRVEAPKSNLSETIGVSTPNTVIMVANVTPYKDYSLFLNIAHSVLKHRDDVTFISVGKILPQYSELAAPYVDNKHPRIKFLGFREDISQLINGSDIGLLCTFSEGISNAIIEIMAHGLPVITNDINGGTSELITNEVDGIICASAEMERNINLLLDNRELRMKMGAFAKTKIHDDFSLATMVNTYQRLYEKLAGDNE